MIDSLDAEKGLIGALLLSPDRATQAMGTVSSSDFEHGNFQRMFNAIADLVLEGKPITVNTVSREAGLSASEVTRSVEGATGEEWSFWAKQVQDAARRRDLLAAGEEAIRLANSDSDPAQSFSKITTMLLDEGRDSLDVRGLSDATDRIMAKLEDYASGTKTLSGVPVGWASFDEVTDGLKSGTVTLVYAPTSQFKSMFVTNLAWNLGYDGVPGLMFTTEMPTDQVVERLLQIETRMNIKALRQSGAIKENLPKLKSGMEVLSGYKLWFQDRSVLDLAYLSTIVLHAKKRHGIQYVVVDLVDHVHSDRFKDNDLKNEMFVIQQLKDLAKRCEVAIVATAHIKKQDFSQRQDRSPVIALEDIKGASSKYQDVDLALSLQQVAWELDKHGNGRWLAATREQRLEQQMIGAANLMCGVTKNRDGELRNLMFTVDIRSGGSILPVDTTT